MHVEIRNTAHHSVKVGLVCAAHSSSLRASKFETITAGVYTCKINLIFLNFGYN